MHLVDELIEEILSRLPVKSLLRFRCVSKSWLSLISSDRFIETHRRNSKNRRCAVIFLDNDVVLNECSLQQLLNEPSSIQGCPLYDRSNTIDMVKESFGVVGCCNGLLCIVNRNRIFRLWNPATQMIPMSLPDLGLVRPGHLDFGFGWDRKSGAYKVCVLHIQRIPRVVDIHVYSSKTNAWKTRIKRGRLGESDDMGVFAAGRIHWLTETGGDYITSLELESELLKKIELPFKPSKFHRRTLAEIGGCLHLLCVHDRDDVDAYHPQSFAVVWVMKENESNWLKLVTLSLDFDDELRYLPMHPLFGEGPNGEILIIFRDDFLVYYPKDDAHVVRKGKMIIPFSSGRFYVESLVMRM